MKTTEFLEKVLEIATKPEDIEFLTELLFETNREESSCSDLES